MRTTRLAALGIAALVTMSVASGALGAQAVRSGAAPAAAAGGRRAPLVRIDYVEDTLPNGLKVLYHVDRSTPVVAVNIWYDVGAKNEEVGRTGFAHLFEHMMFKGSRNVADGEHWRLLERAGGRAGVDINGTTWTDRTNYFEQIPSNQLELALWLEADRMGTLTETLTKEKLDNQREVVKNERRQSFDNQPYGSWFEKMLYYAYPEEHPYHHGVIGSMRDLSAASVEDVRAFFQTYYAPNNAVLAIVGDFDVAAAKALVRKHFGDIPRGPAVPKLEAPALPPTINGEVRTVVLDANAPAPAVYVGFRVPSQRDSAAAAVTLLGSIVADGKTGRLFKSLVRERQMASNVFGGNFAFVEGADLLFFAAIGKPGTNADSLERALLAEVEKVKSGIAADELERVKASQRFQFVDGLQNTGGFNGRADRLNEGEIYFGDPNYVNTVLDRYDAVTVDQLTRLASERLIQTNRVILVYLPNRPQPQPKVVP